MAYPQNRKSSPMSEATKAKIRATHIRKLASGEIKPSKGFEGKKHSLESRLKISTNTAHSGGAPMGNTNAAGHVLSDIAKQRISVSNTGKVSPRKGYKFTVKESAMMSIRRKGKWTGEQNPRWKGGVTPADRTERLKFRHTIQSAIFARDNYTCQICDQYGGNLQVDHIKSWSEYPELRFVESNCRTLCMACHYYVTFKRKIPDGVIWGHNLSRRIAS